MQNEQLTTSLDIEQNNGLVHLKFGTKTDILSFDFQTANEIAEAIARCAYNGKFGIVPSEKRSAIADNKRSLLIMRATHIIRSMLEKKIKPGIIATHVVDKLLSEVL